MSLRWEWRGEERFGCAGYLRALSEDEEWFVYNMSII